METHLTSKFLSFLLIGCLLSIPLMVSCDGSVYEDGLKNYTQLNLPKVIGPESIAFDCLGRGPYVSVSDGRILRWLGHKLGWREFAIPASNRDQKLCDGSTNPKLEPKCGRPLGLKFNPKTCDLYIADAYYGLQVVGPKGGVARLLSNSAQGVPFRFTNSLDIDTNTGVVYFTDSSILFQRRQYFLSIVSGDKTGRLLKYDPRTRKVSVLYKGLAMPNGLALSKDNSFLVVAESGTMRILKFPLPASGDQPPYPETFAELARFPDNIKTTSRGEFWVALNSARGKIQRLEPKTSLKGGQTDIDWFGKDPVGIKFSEDGKVVKVLGADNGDTLDSVSEIEEHIGGLWIGSSVQPYVGHIRL